MAVLLTKGGCRGRKGPGSRTRRGALEPAAESLLAVGEAPSRAGAAGRDKLTVFLEVAAVARRVDADSDLRAVDDQRVLLALPAGSGAFAVQRGVRPESRLDAAASSPRGPGRPGGIADPGP